MSGYTNYAIRRILLFIPTILGVGTLVFILMRLVPGDPAVAFLGEDVANKELLAQVRHELRLDRPLYTQYVEWLGGVVRLDIGKSLWSEEPVVSEIKRTFLVTLNIAAIATVLAAVIAIPMGIVSALGRNTGADYFVRAIALTGLAIPGFWLGLMILLTMVLVFNWSPPLVYRSPFDDPLMNLQVVLWPALAVCFHKLAVTSRMVRSTLLEVIREDYIRTAHAKGLPRRLVIVRHALRNTMLPVLTTMGIEFVFLFGGMVVTETVFSIPGIGRLLVDSIHHRDYPMIEGIVMFIALIVVSTNLLVDLLYGWLDPRVTYK